MEERTFGQHYDRLEAEGFFDDASEPTKQFLAETKFAWKRREEIQNALSASPESTLTAEQVYRVVDAMLDPIRLEMMLFVSAIHYRVKALEED